MAGTWIGLKLASSFAFRVQSLGFILFHNEKHIQDQVIFPSRPIPEHNFEQVHRAAFNYVLCSLVYDRRKLTNAPKQAGEFYTGDSNIHITSPSGTPRIRRRGPNFECTGHSIFGYFLPLMTILGEIVDLYHAKNHPRFGVGFRSAKEWEDHTDEIARQLETYGQSLKEFENRHLSIDPSLTKELPQDVSTNGPGGEQMDIGTPSVHSVHTSSSGHLSEADIQTRIVVGTSLLPLSPPLPPLPVRKF